MHRIDTPTAQADKFGPGKNGFTGGNPQTGELPTALNEDFFDAIQEEMAGVIEAAGIVLDKAKHNQLLTAIRELFLSRSNPFGDIKADGTAAVALALSNLGLPQLITGDAPAALNTLEKLADAIGNDANFSNSLSVILGNKQNKDNTLTDLSGKTVAQLLQYLGLPHLITGDAPAALNTLEKLANAIGNDSNFSNSLSVILGNKQAKDDTLTNLSGKTAAQIAVYIGALRQSQNLADLPNPQTARTNLEVPRGVDAQMPFAWCKFNGASGQVYRSYNISSVKKDGTGQYAFNFASPSVTPNYIVVGSAVLPGAGVDQIARVFGATDRLSTGFNAISMDNNTDNYADAVIDLIVLGG